MSEMWKLCNKTKITLISAGAFRARHPDRLRSHICSEGLEVSRSEEFPERILPLEALVHLYSPTRDVF
jgi:hypothetical protein